MSHRQMTSVGIDLIKHFEGFSASRYICPAGFWTIGYGHLIRKGEKWDSPTAIISEAEALELLDKDNDDAEKAVLRLISVPLADSMFDALVSFTFNLGSGSLQRSTLRSRLNRWDYLGVAEEEFPKWCWGGGRKLAGLYRRRITEKNLFLTGVLSL